MRTLHLIIIFTIASIGLSAQSNWHQVNSGVQEKVSSIIFQDSLIGYATAGNKILKSTDAGENWTFFYQDTNLYAFSEISFHQDSLFVEGVERVKDTFGIRKSSIHLINKQTKQPRTVNLNDRLFTRFGFQSLGNKFWIQSDSGTLEYKNGNLSLMQFEFEIFNFYEGAIIGVSEYEAFTSLDSGLTWDTLTLTNPMFDLNNGGGYYVGGDTVVVFNSGFPVFYAISYDKGLTFNQKSFRSISRVIHINSQKILGIKEYNADGIVVSSVDGGLNTLADTLKLNSMFWGIYKYSNNMLFVYGDNGDIFKSTNLGGLVGLNEKNDVNLGEIKIYPNPTNDFLKIDWKDQSKYKVSQLKVVNALGKEMQVIDGFKSQIDLNGYPKGVYFLQIISDKGIASKSFVVK